MSRVDCGECSGTMGCAEGHCTQAKILQMGEARRRGQLELELPPVVGHIPRVGRDHAAEYAQNRAEQHDRQALELQRRHQDCTNFRR